MGILGDPAAADDVAQEVALVALRRRGSLRDGERLDGWLHRIAVRRALREARRASRRRAVEAAAAVPDHAPADRDDRDAAALLAGLPPRQRAALTLRYVHDLPDAGIAAALGCRTGTVRSLLSRGRATLRAAHPDLLDPEETP
jgi:RNA polymerase sigma-70 factor (ECF subfamily)